MHAEFRRWKRKKVRKTGSLGRLKRGCEFFNRGELLSVELDASERSWWFMQTRFPIFFDSAVGAFCIRKENLRRKDSTYTRAFRRYCFEMG